MATDIRTRIVQEVAAEWRRDGRLHVPPDDTSEDADLAFWSEVDRRIAQRTPVHKQTPEEFQQRMRDAHG